MRRSHQRREKQTKKNWNERFSATSGIYPQYTFLLCLATDGRKKRKWCARISALPVIPQACLYNIHNQAQDVRNRSSSKKRRWKKRIFANCRNPSVSHGGCSKCRRR